MDKINTIVGDYKIVSEEGIFNQRKLFRVKCNICGNEKTMQFAEFIRQKNKHSVKSCSENYMKNELTKIYGDFKILSYNSDWTYDVECIVCGKHKKLLYNELHSNLRISHKYCSNGDDDGSKEWKKFHSIWTSMRTRTSNKNSKFYPNYGGRGINSDEYIIFMDFKTDFYSMFLNAINRYGFKEVSIDRIDNDKSYIKNNIRFTDKKTQARNTRRIKNCIAISPSDQIYEFSIIKDFAEEHNLCNSCISLCLRGKQDIHKGWKFKYK